MTELVDLDISNAFLLSPVESVLALRSEEVDVVLEPQFEDKVLLNGVLGIWLLYLVSQ